uniref:Uncharacterized protein n=1 Tax=Cucumis melo TaxID=3656 RepID=A0A9I9E928_CUCME
MEILLRSPSYGKLYLLLIGTTALSLIGFKGDIIRSDSVKQRTIGSLKQNFEVELHGNDSQL